MALKDNDINLIKLAKFKVSDLPNKKIKIIEKKISFLLEGKDLFPDLTFPKVDTLGGQLNVTISSMKSEPSSASKFISAIKKGLKRKKS